MRAKEYLEINKKKIYHYDLVKKAVYDLYPLRNNKRQTEAYFNRYLFADARYRSHAQYYADNAPSAIFNESENEIDKTIAHKVRMEILNVISGDDTFVFAYNIIALGANKYDDNHPIMTVNLKEENLNTVSYIEDVCKKYKEDYPKASLADYLLDDDNRAIFYNKRCDLLKDEEWWLCAFNKAYEIFDRLRVKISDPFKAQYIVKNIYFNDKVLESTIVGIIKSLIDNYTYDLTDAQKKKFAMLSDNINGYGNDRFKKIDETYLANIYDINLDETNWLKSTQMFNYDIIFMWATHEAFSLEQRLHIIELIENRYLIEREKHPDIFIYDLSQFFVSLREHVCTNCVGESGEGRYSQTRSERVEELKEQILQLNQIINEKSEEIEKLKAGHTLEMQALKDRITLLTTDAKTKGMTMPQQVLAFYYLFNEMGINFNNSDKTQWARFINTFTGKNFQNIRTELNIDFECKKTQKNLRVVSDLFAELFPRIQQKVINDSQI
ncbi:MAG TPA: hypothetical protein GXX42_05045 [Petrimonas sp.]|uniref:hypothetical protein n=1 Tax=Petrimonas sp. TaxID=2023866 RepID=UPI0009648B02|nr:MAG: hypothetical protein BGO33_12630 [Bacteroidia bacterium 43-41]HHV85170.1 hypothetical protein [Petrimonas sp.]